MGKKVLPLGHDEISTYFNYLLARKGNEYWVFERGKNRSPRLGIRWSKIHKVDAHCCGLVPSIIYHFPKLQKFFRLMTDIDWRYVLRKGRVRIGLINLEGDYVLDPIIEKTWATDRDFSMAIMKNPVFCWSQGKTSKSNIRYNSFHKSLMKMNSLEYIYGKTP